MLIGSTFRNAYGPLYNFTYGYLPFNCIYVIDLLEKYPVRDLFYLTYAHRGCFGTRTANIDDFTHAYSSLNCVYVIDLIEKYPISGRVDLA